MTGFRLNGSRTSRRVVSAHGSLYCVSGEHCSRSAPEAAAEISRPFRCPVAQQVLKLGRDLLRGRQVRIDRVAQSCAPKIFCSCELIGRERGCEHGETCCQCFRDRVVSAVADDDVAHPEGGNLRKMLSHDPAGRPRPKCLRVGSP